VKASIFSLCFHGNPSQILRDPRRLKGDNVSFWHKAADPGCPATGPLSGYQQTTNALWKPLGLELGQWCEHRHTSEANQEVK
jgi:hypothetical protein